MAAAICERRILSLTYVGAIEPQLFAPLALYVRTANRLMVDGYEINGKRVRWRELDIEAARDVRQTEHTYTLESTLRRFARRIHKARPCSNELPSES